MARKTTIKFTEVPVWAIDSDSPSRYTVASAIELAGLTGKWVRLTAATQRNLFGRVLFGKCEIRVGSEGIESVKSVCFGTDFSFISLPWNRVEHYITSGDHIGF